jgi:hypothetical protein
VSCNKHTERSAKKGVFTLSQGWVVDENIKGGKRVGLIEVIKKSFHGWISEFITDFKEGFYGGRVKAITRNRR